MRIRAMWCGTALLLAALSGCGSTIAGTAVPAGGGGSRDVVDSGGLGNSGGSSGSDGSSGSGGSGGSGESGTGGVVPATGSLSEALLPDSAFPAGGTVQRLTSVPSTTGLSGATSNPPECAAKVRASQLTGTDGELAAAVYTGPGHSLMMEALERPAAGLIDAFRDVVRTCHSFELEAPSTGRLRSTFEELPDSGLSSQPSVAVHQTISGSGHSLDTYSVVEESQGVTLYVAIIQLSGTVQRSELTALAERALERKRATLH